MNRIAKRLDPRLDEISLFHELTEAESKEFALLDNEMAELESNMSLSGTTASQIGRREAWFGVKSDPAKPLSDRRAVLIAKLRGQGVTTPEFIRNVAASFQYGEVSVDETSAPYVVNIIFESVLGVPPNMNDFIRALEEVKPAHIVFNYTYKYNTWNDLEAFHHTWDEWEEIHVTWDELMTYSESDAGTQSLAASVARTIRKAVRTIGIGE